MSNADKIISEKTGIEFKKLVIKVRAGEDDDILKALADARDNGSTNRATLRRWYNAWNESNK